MSDPTLRRTGEFTDLPEGAIAPCNDTNVCLRISYRGGDGDDAVLEVADGRGRPTVSSPRGWETIRARNAGLQISADTPACGWDGGRIDLVACIDELVRVDDRARS